MKYVTLFEDREFRSIIARNIVPLLKPNLRVLEIMCGDGTATIQYLRETKTGHYLGVDTSESRVKVAQKHGKRLKQIKFQVIKLEKLRETLPSATNDTDYSPPYDMVISNGALSRLPDWQFQQHVLLEMKDLVRKGGTLILTEAFDLRLDPLARLRYEFNLPKMDNPDDETPINFDTFTRWAKENCSIYKADNIGNMYSLLMRVIAPQLDADAAIKLRQIAPRMPALPYYRYSPYFMFGLGV